ncbi:succinate dehydrogenase hydrophobic membrane anchor subunit [Leifsonia aquatica]|jgi:succinate dehydrogenase / fumarate reductase membrane anchor subunit|uniref:Succinate dehydrogenase hydrophobic membrane anchor subunit n=3 Tax=Leifsonia TaxID=110932 RepID=U2RTA5_LEIAQ|nr:succinate dehydrogenase hydrophobic membrane anchor subunit [Leifsonia aquatica]ERK71789.1 succinate dehydrogenase cytochrome b subunit [Leifsonia aquatica ATCC 14665]MBB2965402.1 succinate dehydrogenase / fumarate reductase membrane anchor subunit [Leifsonia aquatica]
MTTIEAPRSPARPARKGVNWEKWGWIYMRLSGLVLIVLIFGHLLVNIVLGDGVKQIDFAFVAGKYATPFWQIWDLLMLWLAMIHGGNGMRTLVNDYAHNKTVNRILRWAILAAVVVMVVLGTLVIFTFDPCPVGAAADQLPSFCPVK